MDNKTLSRLEAAVSKSSHVGPGKKLKVRNEVRIHLQLWFQFTAHLTVSS